MLEINLLPVREARRKADIRQQLMQLLLVLLLTVGAIGFWHSRVAEQISMSEVRVSQMQNDIQQFKPQLDQVAAFKLKKARLEKKIDVIDGLDKARSGPVHVLAELAARTPERLWLTGLDSKAGEIRMEGRSLDNELVALFLRGLGESKYFDEGRSRQHPDRGRARRPQGREVRHPGADREPRRDAPAPAAPVGPATPPPAAKAG